MKLAQIQVPSTINNKLNIWANEFSLRWQFYKLLDIYLEGV